MFNISSLSGDLSSLDLTNPSTNLVEKRLKDTVPKSPCQLLYLYSDTSEFSATIKNEGSVPLTVSCSILVSPVFSVGPGGSQENDAPHQQVGKIGERVEHQQRGELQRTTVRTVQGWLELAWSYLREYIEHCPHDEESDGSVGCFEDVLGIVVSFIVLVGLINLSQQLVSVLRAELFPAQFLPAVELSQRLLHDPGVFDVEDLVIDIRSRKETSCDFKFVKSCSSTYLSPPHTDSMLARYSSLAEARLTRLLASIVTSNMDFGSGIVFP